MTNDRHDRARIVRALRVFGVFTVLFAVHAHAQFVESFDATTLTTDTTAQNGWAYFTGDGQATMTFDVDGQGHGSIAVDATHAKNIQLQATLCYRCLLVRFPVSLLCASDSTISNPTPHSTQPTPDRSTTVHAQ